jgi:nucleoid DNA-binding protein
MLAKESILKSVSELLAQYDCVIVPGLGGFVATQTSASIDTLMSTINPPTKKISFNSQLSASDGLLVNHLSNSSGLSFNEIDTLVKYSVIEFKQQLQSGNTIHVPAIGKLQHNENQKIIFTPSIATNLLPESFGLKQVSLPLPKKQKVVIDEAAVELLVAESEPVNIQVPDIKKRTNKAAFALVMVMIAILFVGQVLFTNAQKDNLTTQQLSFGDISALLNFNKKQPATAIVPSFEIQRSFQLSSPVSNNNSGITPAIKEHITKVASAADLEKGYYIIAGSFKSFDNANVVRKNFTKKGFEAKIIPTENNYYRVGIYVSDKVSEVNSQITAFRAKYQKQAWVMLSE